MQWNGITTAQSWSDFYDGNADQSLDPSKYTSQQQIDKTYVYVTDCLFQGCTSSIDGGAIRTTSAQNFLVEFSSFDSCTTSNTWGGAIKLYNENNGQCVLNKICSYFCRSIASKSSYGQFAYIRVKNAIECKNYVNYSSISRSINNVATSMYAIMSYNGKNMHQNNNFTANTCYRNTAVAYRPFTSTNPLPCSISFSSFVNNTSKQYACIAFKESSASKTIKSSNIVNNKQETSSEGTISSVGSLRIEESCILLNNAATTFYTSGSIVVSRCTMDTAERFSGSFTIEKAISTSFINGLDHLKTGFCQASYDSVGSLVPNKRSILKTRRRATINVLKSLQYIALISMIP